MSLNPLNELKRRLDDTTTPLAKRLCLAKNVVGSHHFATAPKERVVSQWLQDLTDANKLKGDELKTILDWLSMVDELTSELKSKFIQIVAQYVQRTPLQNNDVNYILTFLENPKISSQISMQADEYLSITMTLLQVLHNESNFVCSHRILKNFIKYYRESKKKLEFIIKILNEDNLETIFSFLDTECRKTVIDLCQNILFPINKRSSFISFLQTLIRKDNLDELIAEKGDNIQSVIKIMNTFFKCPKKDSVFLKNFIDVFVSCFHSESQIIFAFYIMVADVLNMQQNFIIPAMTLNNIIPDDPKMTRNLFLHMLEVLLSNEIDINIRLTDTFGEKISKVEIKKNFSKFLQAVMMGQLKLSGKPDKATIQIIKVALKLDPVLVEHKINEILPPIMAAKKSPSTLESYSEMLNCLLQILFKLSRGTIFITQILPFVKNVLEAGNTEQSILNDTGMENSKIVIGNDVFPVQCVNMFGKLTSELMFRQNKELLELLQKDFEEHCLLMLEQGVVNPSTITLTEVMAAILSSFFEHNKMADHTVPLNIAEEFWNMFKRFENECLRKFGESLLKVSFNSSLLKSFLKLCGSFSQLKLLNIKYSTTKMEISQDSYTSEVFELSLLLPCLSTEQWTTLAAKMDDDDALLLLEPLLLAQTMAVQLIAIQNKQDTGELLLPTKSYLIKQLSSHPDVLQDNYFCKALFKDLGKSQTKSLAKCLFKLCLSNTELDILKIDAIANNRLLLNCLVLETCRHVAKCFDNCDSLSKALGKSDFDVAAFSKETPLKEYFKEISLKDDVQDILKICLEIFKQLQIYYLEENYQLVAIFLMLAIKKCCNAKKLKRTIDIILQSIYELSLQQPDLYQIFSTDFIFNFDDKTLMELLTLNKTSNSLLIIRSVLELAVKRVRIDSELVKSIVDLLLHGNTNNCMDSFTEPRFQITCLILPLIVKQKKSITSSAFRTILADLQEKLHITLLEAFKNIQFGNYLPTDNTEVVENDNNTALLNAMSAHSLALAKYCESNDSEEIKNLECLWSGLECFIQTAIKTIENGKSKTSQIESSVQYLNTILRYVKKLETHDVFKQKDKLFTQIWSAIKTRLLIVFQDEDVLSNSFLEDVGPTLRFLYELVTVECFGTNFIGDLTHLIVLKKPSLIQKDETKTDISSRKTFRYLYLQCLKASIIGPKCVAISKLMYRTCKNLKAWIRQHYEPEDCVARYDSEIYTEENCKKVKLQVDDAICEILKLDLDSLSELLLAAKKISLDYKFLDTIFELQHLIHFILGAGPHQRSCEMSWHSFFALYEGCISVLNSLIVSREEILEDRWPCFMQCYRVLVTLICDRATSHTDLDRHDVEKLAEIAHSIEKLTQSICKRKKHVSRISSYTVGDICTALERTAPTKMVRQHLENCVAFLIQASDSGHAVAFLRRALAGAAGQATMTNLYTMYKRYHKYVGNA